MCVCLNSCLTKPLSTLGLQVGSGGRRGGKGTGLRRCLELLGMDCLELVCLNTWLTEPPSRLELQVGREGQGRCRQGWGRVYASAQALLLLYTAANQCDMQSE